MNDTTHSSARKLIFKILALGSILSLFAVSSPLKAAVGLPNPDNLPEHLLLKTTESKLLGEVRNKSTGEVKYAYQSDTHVDTTPSEKVRNEAQKAGVKIVGEIVEKRTPHSQTFSTSDPHKFVTEIQ